MSTALLWNTLFYGETQDRKGYKNTYPRRGGLEDLARKKLGELDSAELRLLRAMIYRAAKDKDLEFLDDSAELCYCVGIDHNSLLKASKEIWSLEEKEKANVVTNTICMASVLRII